MKKIVAAAILSLTFLSGGLASARAAALTVTKLPILPTAFAMTLRN